MSYNQQLNGIGLQILGYVGKEMWGEGEGVVDEWWDFEGGMR